jgi:hypothetical protein
MYRNKWRYDQSEVSKVLEGNAIKRRPDFTTFFNFFVKQYKK